MQKDMISNEKYVVEIDRIPSASRKRIEQLQKGSVKVEWMRSCYANIHINADGLICNLTQNFVYTVLKRFCARMHSDRFPCLLGVSLFKREPKPKQRIKN